MFLHALQNLRDGLLTLAYPQACRLCSGSVESWNDGVVCSACWHNPQLTKLFTNRDACPKCGIPLPPRQQFAPSAPVDSTTNSSQASATFPLRPCGRCDAMPFAYARACGEYAGSLEANVLFLKSEPHLCHRLRQVVAQTYAANLPVLESDFVMPVPLHAARQQERGFNQADLIAQVIGADFHIKRCADSLVRAKNTERHRAGMDEVDRAKSVARAFKVVTPDLLKNRSILLVDDVFTTGQTLSAAAQTLIDAGATQVNVLTLARVVRSFKRP